MKNKYDIIWLQSIDSTNDEARRRISTLDNLSVLSALSQTSGKGQRGNSWSSEPGANLTFSIVLKGGYRIKAYDQFILSEITALSVIDFLSLHGINSFVKWPNDIYALDLTGTSALKLSGILSEAVWEKGALKGVVSGIGINVNFSEKELENAGQPAISLSIIKKSKFDVIFLVEKLAKFLKECYIKYDCNFQEVLDLWKEENRLIGQTIEAVTPTGEVHVGVFKDILLDGAMLLDENGVEFRFDCGDIKLNTKRIDFKQLEV
jgi:BirA family biotin operon repressor/biotin-[acetyl-CoA-carboxylase] ligase